MTDHPLAATLAQIHRLDYVPGELDRTAPPRIWLQLDTDGSNDDRDEPWPGEDGVTWQDEQIGGLEIAYVRADLAALPGGGVDGLREALESIRQYGADTLSGRLRSDGQDDRAWQRAAVLEMTKRAQESLSPTPNPHEADR